MCKRIYVAVDTMISFLHARHIATNNTNDIIAPNTPLHRKKIIQLICIPLSVASFLSLLSVIFLKNQIPQNMDSEKWKQFALSIQQSLHAEKNRFIIVLAIVLVNVLQSVFAFPLLHVTKVLSGYMFGFVSGFLLCVSVEMICVVIVVCLCEKIQTTNDALPSNVRKYFESMRSSWHIIFVLAVLQMSAIPLLSLISLILTNSVSKKEFIFSHLVVSSVMTVKDAWLGQFIATPMNAAYKISIASAVMLISTILPTLCTVFLMAHLTRICMSINNAYALPENMEDVCPICSVKETNDSMCICDNQALLRARETEVDVSNDVSNDDTNNEHDIENEHEENDKQEDA